MKKRLLLIALLVTFSLSTVTVSLYADCRGCCSRHGGVDCIGGVTQCRDGSPLSQKCIAKDCNKCGTVSTVLPTPETVSKPQDPQISALPSDNSITHEAPTVSTGSYRCNGHVAYGIPGPEDQLLCRESYTVGYDYDRKIPSWVAYRLTPESVNQRFKRSNKFKEDAEIPIQYRSILSDYRGSGYDRGHMAASATVDSSYNAMMESFLLSNMTPQLPGLNRQGWRYLEQYIREWANDRGELYVVTGVLFEGDYTVIGNNVHVPTHFYKVVFDSINMDAIAFIVPHRKISKGELTGFIVTVDEVETRAGRDFNRMLDDTVENDIEDDLESMW